jgi:hypothetical protein
MMGFRVFFFMPVCFVVLLVHCAGAQERVLLRSYDGWSHDLGGLEPVFATTRGETIQWTQMHRLAEILMYETSNYSLQAKVGHYFVLLAERVMQQHLSTDDLKGKIETLKAIQDEIQKGEYGLGEPVKLDILQTIQYEEICHRILLGEETWALDVLMAFVLENPDALIGPDSIRTLSLLFLDHHDYAKGLAFFAKVADLEVASAAVCFEAWYRSSFLQERIDRTSPRTVIYCNDAIASTTSPSLVQRAETRINSLRAAMIHK